MRILFLCLYPPLPAVDGGRIRMAGILRELARTHEILLVAFASDLTTTEAIDELASICQSVQILDKPVSRRRGFFDKAQDFFSIEPVGLTQWHSDEMTDLLRGLVAKQQVDILHVDHLLLLQNVARGPRPPVVLTFHNVESLLLAREWAICHLPYGPHLLRRLENWRWTLYERKAARDADAVVTVSADEAAYFRRHAPATPVYVVPNGVDTVAFQPNAVAPTTATLLFTGQMDYLPNVDAMTWFVEEIFPLIRSRRTDAALSIVGRSPTPRVRELAAAAGVAVTGFVADVRPAYALARVFVVPLRIGGGTRLKILQSMAMGVPVVATAVGAEGLGVVDGTHLLLAESAEQFAEQVLAVLHDHALHHRLRQAARAFVEERYDWQTIGRCQTNVYECTVNALA